MHKPLQRVFAAIRLVLLFIVLNSGTVFAQDTIVTTLSAVHQGNGSGLATRTVIDTFMFPHDLSGYQQINMHVILTCPSGGCDPWDRFASVQVYHDTEWFEIGRYVTPYNKACGWTIDVNDYRSMLKDTVILKSFIDTWTNPGWLVSIVFDFIAGAPVYPDIRVQNLWMDYNVVYGDTTQPVNLQAMTRTVDSAATLVRMKIINTGHGQGNTNNAAEFSQKTHTLWVNGTQAASQYLWRSNCASNPCSPQPGTWQYNRAGWCPGADVLPYYADITPLTTPGQPATLEYRLQNYFNTCSPNNPGCVTGAACPDCNYNYNGHTEPHYKITGQLISYIGMPTGITDSEKQPGLSVTPNPSTGLFSIKSTHKIKKFAVFNVLGKIVVSINEPVETVDLSFLPKGIYILQAETAIGTRNIRLMME